MKKYVQKVPDSPYGHLFAAAAHSMAGRDEEARVAADEVIRLNPKFSLRKWGKSLKYKNQDDQERYELTSKQEVHGHSHPCHFCNYCFIQFFRRRIG